MQILELLSRTNTSIFYWVGPIKAPSKGVSMEVRTPTLRITVVHVANPSSAPSLHQVLLT